MAASIEESVQADFSQANALANLVVAEPERFARGNDEIATLSKLALKQLFDFSVKTESDAVPAIAAYIKSVTPQDELSGRSTRSSAKRKRGQTAPAPQHELFEPTPLDELVLDGMDFKQLWEQIDLKTGKVVNLVEKLFVNEGMSPDEDEDEDDEGLRGTQDDNDDEDDEDEEDEDEDEEDDDAEPAEIPVKLRDLSDADLAALGIDPSMRSQLPEDEESEGELEPYAGASDISDGDPNEVFYEPLMTEAEQMRRKEEQEMGMLPRLRSQVGFDVDESDDDEDLDEQEDEQEEEAPRKRSILDSLDDPGSNVAGPSRRGKKHPTLDDDFFSIDEFNRLTQAQELQGDDDENDGEDLSNEVDLFRSFDRGEDMDEDEPGAAPGEMDPSEVKFADFFLPPAKAAKFRKKAERKEKGKQRALQEDSIHAHEGEAGQNEDDSEVEEAEESEKEPEEPERKRTIRFNDTVAVRRIKSCKKKEFELTPEMLGELGFDDEEGSRIARENGYDLDEDEDLDEDMEEDEEQSEDGEGEEDDEDMDEDEDGEEEESEADEDEEVDGEEAQARTARRVAGDLFADSDDEDQDANQLSTHEKRQAALQAEISRLEEENVGKKDWTLMGEAGAKARPQDSLLEQDLEFERTAKVVPQVTEESTATLEDMIKARILERNFDDVIRKREIEALPFLPSRLLELSDAKSSKSLAELYEEEYQASREGGERVSAADAKLESEHASISALYEDVFAKLDALSNAHFTPKAPKASITTLTNAPAVSVESALPATMSGATMLAPEEVYERGRHAAALEGEKSEMAPEERQRLHHTLRREKRARNERITATRTALEQAGLAKQANPRSKAEEKKEKASALKKLMGNRGVSVVGKDGSQQQGGKKRKTQDATPASGSRFKL